MGFDHILIVGFGGPPRPEDVIPFLENVTRGRNILPARLQAVALHYKETGGSSPYNKYAQQLLEQIEKSLRSANITLPIFIGMRNWTPTLREVVQKIQQQGLRKGLAVVLAPHRSFASFDQYVQNIEEAKESAGAAELSYEYLPSWGTHPLFIQAQAETVRHVLGEDSSLTHILFCAHSIPREMAEKSCYVEDFSAASELVARSLGHSEWSCVYQSRSGSPHQQWLEPDVCDAIAALKDEECSRVVVVPIGFISDHTEVLYDLDIEARQEAAAAELGFARASTVMIHPKFVEMFTQLIQKEVTA